MVLTGSVILTIVVVVFVQFPHQVNVKQALDKDAFLQWSLFTSIPVILFSGLDREGSNLVPIVLYWWREGRNIDTELGLGIRAVVGAGFGIF